MLLLYLCGGFVQQPGPDQASFCSFGKILFEV